MNKNLYLGKIYKTDIVVPSNNGIYEILNSSNNVLFDESNPLNEIKMSDFNGDKSYVYVILTDQYNPETLDGLLYSFMRKLSMIYKEAPSIKTCRFLYSR